MNRKSEHGSLTAELAILAPIVILFTLVALGLGRYELARQELTDVARAAAEAASVVPGPGQAAQAATEAAGPALDGQRHMCADPMVATDTGGFVAGGSVRVTVSCKVDLSDLLVPGLPGSVSLQVSQTAPVDPYREVS